MQEYSINYSLKYSTGTQDYLSRQLSVLEQCGITYKRDKRDCHYMDNIKDFMNSIRNGDIIVVVFSRKYMLSKNCMYELSGVMQQENWKQKILPVVVDDSIRERSFYKELVKYWKAQIEELKKVVAEELEAFGKELPLRTETEEGAKQE